MSTACDGLCEACDGLGYTVPKADRPMAEQIGGEYVGRVCSWCDGRGWHYDDKREPAANTKPEPTDVPFGPEGDVPF